jgi:hypothetical protein
MGYRYGIFNYATVSLGGSVLVSSFEMESGAPSSGTTTTTASQPSTTTAPTAGTTQSKWGQCGGSGWTGPTACASGSTCSSANPWYSQCL